MSERFTPDQTHKWFGERLEFLGLNQEQFAKKAGIDEPSVSRYRSQKSRPRIEFIDRIADTLEISIIEALIVLGAIDIDGKNTPKIAEGKKNSRAIWQLNNK